MTTPSLGAGTLSTLKEDEVASPDETALPPQQPRRPPDLVATVRTWNLMGPILRRKKVVSLPLGNARHDFFFPHTHEEEGEELRVASVRLE